MTVNDAMLAVAQNLAQKYGYIEVEAPATHIAQRLHRNPRIHIDMFWGKPRLNISLPDKTFACLTYEASALSEAQAFGPAGLELAAEVKKQIDSLLD